MPFYDSYLVYLNTRNIIKKIGLRSEKTYEVTFRFSLFNMCAFPCILYTEDLWSTIINPKIKGYPDVKSRLRRCSTLKIIRVTKKCDQTFGF